MGGNGDNLDQQIDGAVKTVENWPRHGSGEPYDRYNDAEEFLCAHRKQAEGKIVEGLSKVKGEPPALYAFGRICANYIAQGSDKILQDTIQMCGTADHGKGMAVLLNVFNESMSDDRRQAIIEQLDAAEETPNSQARRSTIQMILTQSSKIGLTGEDATDRIRRNLGSDSADDRKVGVQSSRTGVVELLKAGDITKACTLMEKAIPKVLALIAGKPRADGVTARLDYGAGFNFFDETAETINDFISAGDRARALGSLVSGVASAVAEKEEFAEAGAKAIVWAVSEQVPETPKYLARNMVLEPGYQEFYQQCLININPDRYISCGITANQNELPILMGHVGYMGEQGIDLLLDSPQKEPVPHTINRLTLLGGYIPHIAGMLTVEPEDPKMLKLKDKLLGGQVASFIDGVRGRQDPQLNRQATELEVGLGMLREHVE